MNLQMWSIQYNGQCCRLPSAYVLVTAVVTGQENLHNVFPIREELPKWAKLAPTGTNLGWYFKDQSSHLFSLTETNVQRLTSELTARFSVTRRLSGEKPSTCVDDRLGVPS